MDDNAVVATEPRALRFSRALYERMIDAGIFGGDDHIELLDGEIVEMAPQNSPHATVISILIRRFTIGFGEDFHVRAQAPIALSDDSEPEPDIAVVRGQPRDYRDAHPAKAELIVEVSDTTLAYDRGRKRSAYARAGIAEYWILNTRSRRLEIHRQPTGADYALRTEVGADESVMPLAKPDLALRVADLLP